jgi:Protein of unknown function (DUF3431)
MPNAETTVGVVPPPDNPIELVVARYREGVEWTRNVPASMRTYLYDKGGDLDPTTVPRAEVARLENVGFEAHTYLHHILSRYETLAPVTVFAQGHPFDHVHDMHPFLRGLVAGTERIHGFRWLGFIIDSDDPLGRRLFVPWRKNLDGRELDLHGFCQRLFGEPAKVWSHFHVGAQFAVTSDQIRVRSRAFYEQALELAVSFPDGGACFERVWDRVFDVVGVDPATLDGELCRYLKPIRRLKDAAPGQAPPWHRS